MSLVSVFDLSALPAALWAHRAVLTWAALVVSSGARRSTAFAGTVIASLRQELEPQRARDRGGFDQAHTDAVAKTIGLAGVVADQRVLVFVVAEILAADRARRNETVRAGVIESDEQSGADGARDVSFERGADAVGKEMRDQPIDGFPLGRHGAALS